MAFTNDLSTTIGKFRLLIGDNRENQGIMPDGSNFTDEELQAVLDMVDDDLAAAVAQATAILAKKWSVVSDTQVGPRKESLSQVAKAFERQAASQDGISFSVGFNRDDGYAQEAE